MEAHEYAKMAALQEHHWWFAAKRRMASGLLARHAGLPSAARVLEVGCGTGSMVPTLAACGPVVGLDAYAPALQYLEGAAGVAGDALALPFDEDAFDLVGCFDLLYHRHVPRVELALREVARVLRPEGLFVLTDSACPVLYGRHDAAHHGARRFTREQLETACLAAGIEPVHTTYFHTAVFPAVAAVRIVSRWLPAGSPPPAEGKSQLEPAPGWVNGLMNLIYAVEAPLASRFALPFGVSLAMLGRRRAA